MANEITLNKVLSTTAGYITKAELIAVETEIINQGQVNEQSIIKKSLAQKLDELENNTPSDIQDQIEAINAQLANLGTTADKIIYSSAIGTQGQDGYSAAVTVRDKLDQLTNSLNSLPNLLTFKQEINKIKSDTEQFKKDAVDAKEEIEQVSTQLSNLNNVANQLKVSFDTDAQFAVVSQAAYDALGDEQNKSNFIYFIY